MASTKYHLFVTRLKQVSRMSDAAPVGGLIQQQEMTLVSLSRSIRISRRVAIALGLLLAGMSWQGAQAADPLARPTGPVILTVTGAISVTNAPGKAEFDLKMLQALGVEQLTTTTNWTDGKQVFEGVQVHKLLDAVGAHGTTISAVALDDYASDIPIDDFTKYPALLAYSMNGKVMTARDKGPIWIVYPRDDHPELKDPLLDSHWVWQLKDIDVK